MQVLPRREELRRVGLSAVGHTRRTNWTMPEISWLHDPDEACQRAKVEGKLALIDFFSPV
jgi:hypothetical protein